MFVDVVGSTDLSERLEPEAYADVIIAYRAMAAQKIHANGGSVGRFVGDGILAYFGYPAAAANSAARAVQAALEIVCSLDQSPIRIQADTDESVQARIGIHTGITIIGDLGGSGVLEEGGAIGHAANVAARVQSLAEPGQVLITDDTLQLIEPHFRVEPLSSVTLKGLSRPVTVYRVRERTNVSRGLRRPLRRQARLHGRSGELTVLGEHWRRTLHGRGSGVMISGEAGIGKSRLVLDLIDAHVTASGGRVLQAECLEHRSLSAFNPFRELLHTELGIAATDPPEIIASRLDQVSGLEPSHTAALQAFLLMTAPDPAISPAKQRENLMAAILAWIEVQQRLQPLMLVLEDLHWSDDSALLLLEQIIAGAETMRLMVVATARDQPERVVAHDLRLSRLRLPPLDSAEASGLLHDLAGARVLEDSTVESVLRRAEGNPLFLEELAHTWLHNASSGQAKVWGVDAVPPSLRDALMERLDRTGNAKALAQLAAVIGLAFSVPLLEACLDQSVEQVRNDIATLVDASILRPRHNRLDGEYEFRHALIHQTAFESLLPSRRRTYHDTVVRALRSRFPEFTHQHPETLAGHLEQAGQIAAAVKAWLAAGRLAAAQSANVEALAHLDRAMALLRGAGKTVVDVNELTLDVLLAMGGPLIARYGWAAEQVDRVYAEAIDVCTALGDERRLFDVLRGRQNVFLLRGALRQCHAICLQLLPMAERANDATLFLEVYRGLGVCAFLAGDFRQAIDQLDTAFNLFDPAKHNAGASIYGTNPGVVTLSWRAWARWFIDESHAASADIQAALSLARAADHPFSEGYALCFAASICQCQGDGPAALKYAEAAIELSESRGYPYWRAWAGIVRGWALGMTGRPAEGLAVLEAALSDYMSSGAQMIVGYAHALAAQLEVREGQLQAVAMHVTAAESAMKSTGMIFFHRLLDGPQALLERKA